MALKSCAARDRHPCRSARLILPPLQPCSAPSIANSPSIFYRAVRAEEGFQERDEVTMPRSLCCSCALTTTGAKVTALRVYTCDDASHWWAHSSNRAHIHWHRFPNSNSALLLSVVLRHDCRPLDTALLRFLSAGCNQESPSSHSLVCGFR